MKVIGVLGGMSWESTLHYYRLLNLRTQERLGGLHSARLLLHSVDFAPIARMQAEARWDEAGAVLADAALSLHRGGAELLVLATNTMHRVAEHIEAKAPLPLIHIADPTADAVRAAKIERVGLLATRFTMEQAFYKDRLAKRHGLKVLVPGEAERTEIHRVIYEELCLGAVKAESRAAYQRIVEGLLREGAQGIILGCTEIMMLIGQDDVPVPVFDTTALHAAAAVDRALD